MSKGVLLFANNNGLCPYDRLAGICAFFVKKHLGVDVALVTDTATLPAIEADDNPYRHLFDQVIIRDEYPRNGCRVYPPARKGASEELGEFKNTSRLYMDQLTPFDETLFIDSDYILMNDSLNGCWGSIYPVLADTSMVSIVSHDFHVTKLYKFGIPTYWSTVMYFNKNHPETETVFDGIRYVHENYDYFSWFYGYRKNMFRNDIAVSIIAHLLHGGTTNATRTVIGRLPDPTLMFAWENQPILSINDDGEMFMTGEEGLGSAPYLSKIKNQSVHLLNKNALLRVIEPYVLERL